MKSRINWANKYLFFSSIFFLYSLIYIIYTFPLITDFRRGFLGDDDAHSFIFNCVNFQLSESPFFTNLMFFPNGSSTVLNTNCLTMSYFASFFQNEILGLNIFLLLSFGFSGLGGYVFSHRYLENKYFAIICGFVFAFSSYKMARLGCHYNLVITGAIPFLMHFYLNIFHSSKKFSRFKNVSKKDILFFVLTLLFSVFSDYIITICAFYFLFFYSMFYYVKPLYNRINLKKWQVFIALVLVVLAMDLLIQILRLQEFDHNGGLWFGGDLTSLFIPYHARFVGSEVWLETYYHWIGENAKTVEGVMYFGFSLAAIGSVALVIRSREILPEKVQAILFSSIFLMMISMPQVRIMGKRLFFSPTAIQHFIPFINQMRSPIRVFYIAVFLIAILIFFLLQNSKWKYIINKWQVGLFFFTLLFIDYFPAKYPIQILENSPQVYYELEKKTGNGVLIYPFGITDGYKKRGDFQLDELSKIAVHKKSILGGYLSRVEDGYFSKIEENLFLNTLCDIEENKVVSYNLKEVRLVAKELILDYILIPEEFINAKGSLFIEEVFHSRIRQKEVFSGGVLLTID